MTKKTQNKKKENPFISLIVSIVIPAIILSKFSSEAYLGTLNGFLIALAFPIGLGLYNFIVLKQLGFVAILGFISTFLTGIIGILNFPTEWLAIKEGAIPLLIGLAVLISMKTPYPLVRKLLYNEEVLDINKINQLLKEKGEEKRFNNSLNKTSYMLAGSFFLSAVLNFFLTKIIVTSPTGTEAFNAELGKLTALSYPIIALPSVIVMLGALWFLFNKLKTLTNLTTEELFSPEIREKTK